MLHSIRSVAGLILLFSSTVGLASSLLVMLLIYRMQTWKSYHRIVFTLCTFQAIYDIAYFFLPGYDNNVVLGIYRFLATFSGIAVCVWTNFISWVNLYTISYLQPFPLTLWHQRAVYLTLFTSTVFAGIFLLVSLVKDADNTMDYLYFYFRVISTLFNVVMFCVLYFIFNRTDCAACIDSWFSQFDFTMRDMTQDLLAVLSTKLMYYPVVQIFARVICLWWEYRYGFTVSAFDKGDYSTRKAGAMILYALFSPSAGLGYILTFLYVHPKGRMEIYYVCRDIYRFFITGKCTSASSTASLQIKLVEPPPRRSESFSTITTGTNNHPTESVISDARSTYSTVPANSLNSGNSNSNFTQTSSQRQPPTIRDSVSSTTVERDSYIQVNPVVPKGAASSGNVTVSYTMSTDNPIVTVRKEHSSATSRTVSEDIQHNLRTISSSGNFPLHPSATGFEQRVFHEHWTIASFAYDMDEQLIWEEFFRRKLERESMTVHHDKV